MSNSFSDAIKAALAKKLEQHHPQGKNDAEQRQKTKQPPRAKGSPVRKSSGRGG